jgi:gentisate 1,2-dioxygenase
MVNTVRTPGPAPMTDEARRSQLAQLHDQVASMSTWGFWGEDPDDEHQATDKLQENPRKAVPFIWRYADLHPILLRAAELIPMTVSERRSLMLINPALGPAKATLTTLIAAYRINVVDETMPPHRHSPNAIRLGLTGDTNFTGVQGENITFGPGDLVLTPQDTWHNHGNGPDEASVNLSVLDIPLVEFLNSMYFEFDYREDEGGKTVPKTEQTSRVPADYSQRVYGVGGLLPRTVDHNRGSGTCSPMFVYRWESISLLLDRLHDHDGSPFEGIVIEYVNPVTGGPTYKTMTFFAQLLRPAERLLPVRQSMNQLFTVFSGQGRTIIDGTVFQWEPFDTFCIPGGSWYKHENDSDTNDAVFFVSSDEPTLRALGLSAKYGRDRNGDAVLIESARSIGE